MRYRRVAWLGAVALLTVGPARAFDGWHLESATVIEGKAWAGTTSPTTRAPGTSSSATARRGCRSSTRWPARST